MKTMLIHKIQMGLSVCSRFPNKIKWASMSQLFSFTVFLLHVKKFSVTSRYFAFTDNFFRSQRSLLFCCIDIYVYKLHIFITGGRYKAKEITSIIYILYVYFFFKFSRLSITICYIFLHYLSSPEDCLQYSTPIKFSPKKIIDFSLYLEKSIFKSSRVL